MVITYFGKERLDLIYYLSLMGKKLNKNVAVIDNSLRGDLYRSVVGDTDSHLTEKNGCTYARSVDVKDTDVADFDMVLIYNGLYEKKTPYQLQSNMRLIDTSMDLVEMEQLKRALPPKEDEETDVLILSDVTSKKISPQYAKNFLGITTDKDYMFPLDNGDYDKFVILTQNGNGTLKGLSEYMMEFLADFAKHFWNIDEKKFKKTFLRGRV